MVRMMYAYNTSKTFVLALLLLLPCSLLTITSAAQDEPEYKMELGGGVGLTNYLGDFNDNLTRDIQPMAGIVAKYKVNPRTAWSAVLNYGTLKGNSRNEKTYYPDYAGAPISFSTKLTDFSIRFEYNFWPFGTGNEYYGAKAITPFIALGAGLAFAKGDETATAFQMPIGFGVKYKLQKRLNLALEWMMHFSGSDRLDGVSDPYGIKSSDLFKNTDCYQGLQLTLTYEFMEKCKTCHNDRE